MCGTAGIVATRPSRANNVNQLEVGSNQGDGDPVPVAFAVEEWNVCRWLHRVVLLLAVPSSLVLAFALVLQALVAGDGPDALFDGAFDALPGC